ncbi:reverse transcriptase domain-containing protein [Tanacetum coccineum]|uniref:Reverse transcriptase domain-containing protein n=1 Tax=Tanacetum coccineum TaxID=301880 RepID=A0ABQ5IGU7_9ASTR
MEKGFLTANGRWSGKDVKEKHKSMLDDSGTASNKVKECIGIPSTVVSNEEPKSRDSLGGKHNVGSAANPNLGTATDMTSTPSKDANLNNINVGPVSFVTLLKGDTTMFFCKFSSKDRMKSMLENGVWLIRNVPLILREWTPDANIIMEDGRASYARVMVKLRADVNLQDTVVVLVPKFVGEGFHMRTIHVEYEWTPPRCSSCKVFGHLLDECPKQLVLDVLKNLKNHGQAIRGLVVSSPHEFSPVASGSSNTTLSAEIINNLERQMLDRKLMLVDDDGKPLNKVEYASVNSDSDSDVEVAYDETAQFMASRGVNDASLNVDEDYDIHDTYDIEGLMKQDLAFCDMMDINLRGRDRR